MQGVSAMPMLRPWPLTVRHSSATSRQRLALLGRGAADLLGEHRDADAAPAGGVEAVLDRDVVVGHDRLDLDALALGQVGGHLEVQHVAGVVLDDVQHAGAAVDGLGRLEHLVGRRRGEDLARAGRVEHARPDEAAVHRLVAGAAAGDDPDLALDRRVGAHDHLRVVDHAQWSPCAASMPSSASLTTASGSLMSFFMRSSIGRPALPAGGPYRRATAAGQSGRGGGAVRCSRRARRAVVEARYRRLAR